MTPSKSTSGWLFQFSNDSGGLNPIGLVIGNRGGLVRSSDSDSVRQSILMLLSTLPGERIGRPSYGCDLKRLVFEPNDEATAGMAIHYVGSAIRRWEPRVDITRLTANADPIGSSRLVIAVEYTIREVGIQDLLSLTLDLQ